MRAVIGLRSLAAALHTAAMLAAAVLSLSLSLPAYAEPAYRLATPEVREAIEEAYAEADPRGLHPWWRAELYLICKRESRCGRDGLVGVHGNDRDGAGRSAWTKAVEAGDLDPVDCPEHAWAPKQWGTRGLFGMNAARGVAMLGCVGPEAMDDPEVAAHLAVQRFVSCPRWFGRECDCIDHTRLWVGLGTFARRPLLGKRSQVVSVARQCGGGVAAWHLLTSMGWIFGP